jgi:RimJ/RimL family protein N-acetyltransferase
MRDVVQDDRKARFLIQAKIGIRIADPFSGLVFVDDERTIGAAVFNNYDGRDIHFTCAMVENNIEIGMRIARRVAWYVFKVMDCHRCTATTPRSNLRAITALETLGFRFEGVLREYFPNDEDGMVYGLLRCEQKILREGWLAGHGFEERGRAEATR